MKKAAERAGVIWDTRSKLDVVNDIRDTRRAAYPSGLASAYAADNGLVDSASLLLPLGNISFATIVTCNESGHWETYQSDRYGFNNDDAIYKNQGLRVLLIGDSFAQGECVKQEQNVAGWLGHHGYSTINLGISGSGPLLELARLREYGSHFDPDIVVWLYFKNDPDHIASEYRFSLFRRYLERDFSQGLISRQDEIDKLLNRYLDDKVGRELRNRNKGSDKAETDIGDETRFDTPPK